ncbi:hypothetical protein CARUB_v10010977mg [Capsella rubella]|uniref:Agenet domain-containing protein n=1 Tax=Capsella rubella TaxID=81985 RepID=R0GMX2_9BRAS|nr:DUF724 domain-containing protein 3 [Capsella rubella]EOA37307.1 hypothetical protein CARUB_v10010977mg [Capsella rubella]
MEQQTTTKKIMKDCEVEVSSEEEGFEGAWFRAILEEAPRCLASEELRVRYLTLLDMDGSSPLIEHIEQRFIRPVPPEENRQKDVVLEEGTVVDADHKDGWWTGVVVKKLEDENYLVYFDLPPDIIQFERKHLRVHLNWTGSKWVRPEIKELDKSMFSSGTMVEVSSAKDVAWFPAMMIQETDEDDKQKFIVKDWNKYLSSKGDEARPNKIVDSRRVRPIPPPSSVDKYSLLDCVEALRGSGWYKGKVRKILHDRRYMVSLEATKEETVFKHSDLRPFMVWEDGVWLEDPKPKPIKDSPPNVLRNKPIRSCSGAKPVTPKMAPKQMRSSVNPEEIDMALTEAENSVATGDLGKKRPDAVMMNDKAPPVITQQVTSIARETVSPVTPSPVITATPLKQAEALSERKKSPKKTPEPLKNQNGLESSPTRQEMSEEENGEDNSKKRKREQRHNSDVDATDGTCNGSKAQINDTSSNICIDDVDEQPLSAWINISTPSTERSSDQIPNVVDNSAAEVEEPQAKRTLMSLPFEKSLPFWKTYEAEEAYKIVPQNPHFTPLVEAKEDIREWSAVGMMVSFYGLLKEVKDLRLDVSSSKLSSLSSSFAELEKHGFDVATPQSRIDKVLSLQDGRAKKVEERKCLEKKIEAEETERHKVEEEMVELERKILELKRQEAVGKEKKETADKKIVQMKSCAEIIDQEIADVELEFLTSVLAPW